MRLTYTKKVGKELDRHPQPQRRLRGFLSKVLAAKWESPREVSESVGGVDNWGRGVMCFDILGNRFRLVAFIDYEQQVFEVLFFGEHADYDRFRRQWRR